MTTVTDNPTHDTEREAAAPVARGPVKTPLQVNSYDQASSLLVSLILIIGFFVTMMFLIWLTTVLTFSSQAVQVQLLEENPGTGERAKGYADELEEPGMEELEELETPQLEATLEAVTDAVTSVAASLDALSTDALVSGKGNSLGDRRASGSGGDGDGTIPRGERWQVRYATDSLATYARQLDFFRIELGAAGGSEKVDYAKGFSSGSPQRRSATGDLESRLYMTWTTGALKAADVQLLGVRHVPTQRRIVLQFYPPDIENQLANVELQYAQPKGKTVRDIRRTIFGVRQNGSRYEYYVMEQLYRW